MLLPLTEKQQIVFDALSRMYLENGYPPTQVEVSDKINKSAVSGEIKALRQKGWLMSMENLSRRNILPTEEALQRFGQQDLFTGKHL